MKAFIVAVAMLVAMAGCGKDKKITGPIPGPGYAVPSTPFDVLHNLSLAYSSRDSSKYKAAFDNAYLGTSFDNSGGTIDTFYRFNEAQHISALARSNSITNVTLQFPPSMVRFSDAADPPGWATVQFGPGSGFNVEIDDSPSGYFLSRNVSEEFKFVPTAPDSTSPTDTTWKIIRWTEINP